MKYNSIGLLQWKERMNYEQKPVVLMVLDGYGLNDRTEEMPLRWQIPR